MNGGAVVKPAWSLLMMTLLTGAPGIGANTSLAADATPVSSAATPTHQQPPGSWKKNLFVGGGVGLGFGDVDWVSVEPLIGYRIHPKVTIGTSLIYQWQSDDRYSKSVSTTSYGGRVFAQYYPRPVLFFQAEYEYLNYEYVQVNLSTVRTDASSVLAGAGISQPLGGRGFFFASALYNFSYDSNDLTSPYSSPWVYRAGVGFGF
jgi:hypothetical protein